MKAIHGSAKELVRRLVFRMNAGTDEISKPVEINRKRTE